MARARSSPHANGELIVASAAKPAAPRQPKHQGAADFIENRQN
jgi:hypothetical protein